MKKERTIITQELCDHVKILLAGGANLNKAAEITKTGHATISRIKAAGYDAEIYRQNTAKKREKNRKEEEQLQGQMEMELQTAEEPKQELPDQVKMMRFLAGQAEKIMQAITAENEQIRTRLDNLNETMGQILQAVAVENTINRVKIDKLNDTMGQILRAIRKE